MFEHTKEGKVLKGLAGSLPIRDDDHVTERLAMLFEVQCEGASVQEICQKFGLSRQWYYALLERFEKLGAEGLRNQKKGPQRNYRRDGEITRQVIRYRCLDSQVSASVIAQRLRQNNIKISTRSVERIIAEYGLQKKTSLNKTKART